MTLLRRQPPVVLAAFVLVFLSFLVGRWVDHAPNVGGDTPILVNGAQAALNCIEDGVFSSCAENPQGTINPYYTSFVGPWPPLQYAPSITLLALGANQQQVLTALSLLSVLAFLGTLWLAWVLARRLERPGLAWLLWALALSGPFLWYGNNTFGESLASFLVCAFVVAVVSRPAVWLVALAAFAAALTKETAFPFVAALAAILSLAPPLRDPALTRPRLIGTAIGIVAALVVHAAFNVFRFGTLRNVDLLQEAFVVPGLARRAEYFLALLVSPNGGLLAYWPLAIAGLVALAAVALARRSWPALALLAVAGGLLAGLASYHTPFGWHAWGPRLAVPWVLPLAFAAAAVFGRGLAERATRALGPSVAVVLGALVLTAAAAPHLGVMHKPPAALELFLPPKGACAVDAQIGSDQYYRCVSEQAWERRPVMLSALGGLASPRGVLLLGSFLLAAAGLLELTRRRIPEGA